MKIPVITKKNLSGDAIDSVHKANKSRLTDKIKEMKETNAPLSEIVEEGWKVINKMETSDAFDTYYSREMNCSVFEVNVKLHRMEMDTEEAVKSLGLPESREKRLIEAIEDIDFSEKYVEAERDYLIDYLGGCSFDSPQYLKALKEKISNGEKSGYPAIDELSSIDKKKSMIDEWINASEEFLRHTSEFDFKNDAGFSGRSGGHFVFGSPDALDTMREDARDELDKLSDVTSGTIDRFIGLVDSYQNYAEAVRYVQNLVKDRKNEVIDGAQSFLNEEVSIWYEENLEGKLNDEELIQSNPNKEKIMNYIDGMSAERETEFLINIAKVGFSLKSVM